MCMNIDQCAHTHVYNYMLKMVCTHLYVYACMRVYMYMFVFYVYHSAFVDVCIEVVCIFAYMSP